MTQNSKEQNNHDRSKTGKSRRPVMRVSISLRQQHRNMGKFLFWITLFEQVYLHCPYVRMRNRKCLPFRSTWFHLWIL